MWGADGRMSEIAICGALLAHLTYGVERLRRRSRLLTGHPQLIDFKHAAVHSTPGLTADRPGDEKATETMKKAEALGGH